MGTKIFLSHPYSSYPSSEEAGYARDLGPVRKKRARQLKAAEKWAQKRLAEWRTPEKMEEVRQAQERGKLLKKAVEEGEWEVVEQVLEVEGGRMVPEEKLEWEGLVRVMKGMTKEEWKAHLKEMREDNGRAEQLE